MNDSLFTNHFTQLQIIATVITVFGIALFTLALRRKHLRSRVQGLQKFAVTDRAPFSKNTENTLQKIGLIMFLAGIITITFVAVKQSDKAVYNQQEQSSST